MRISFVPPDAMRGGDRIEVDQASTDSRPEGPAQEVLNVVVSALRTNGVTIILDQSVEDSVDVGGSHLAQLHLRDELLDDVVIAFVTLDGYIAQLSPSFAANACSQIRFEVGLYGVSRLTLSLSEVYLSEFQISQRLHIIGDSAALIVANFPKFLVCVDAPLDPILHDPLAHLQNPPPAVDPDMSALHWLGLPESVPSIPPGGYRMGTRTLNSQSGVHF